MICLENFKKNKFKIIRLVDAGILIVFAFLFFLAWLSWFSFIVVITILSVMIGFFSSIVKEPTLWFLALVNGIFLGSVTYVVFNYLVPLIVEYIP